MSEDELNLDQAIELLQSKWLEMEKILHKSVPGGPKEYELLLDEQLALEKELHRLIEQRGVALLVALRLGGWVSDRYFVEAKEKAPGPG